MYLPAAESLNYAHLNRLRELREKTNGVRKCVAVILNLHFSKMEIMVGLMRRALMEKRIKGLLFIGWCAALMGINNF